MPVLVGVWPMLSVEEEIWVEFEDKVMRVPRLKEEKSTRSNSDLLE